MFSFHGASRDNDRCCARFANCENAQLVPSKSSSRIGNVDRIVESYICLRHLRYFRICTAEKKKRHLDKYTRKVKTHER